MQWAEYRGWTIRAHEQARIPPHMAYVAYCKRESRTRLEMANVEGATITEAIERARAEVDRRCDILSHGVRVAA